MESTLTGLCTKAPECDAAGYVSDSTITLVVDETDYNKIENMLKTYDGLKPYYKSGELKVKLARSKTAKLKIETCHKYHIRYRVQKYKFQVAELDFGGKAGSKRTIEGVRLRILTCSDVVV